VVAIIGMRNPTKPLTDESEMAAAWANLKADISKPGSGSPDSVVEDWQKVSCAAEGAPYVARGLFFKMTRFISQRNLNSNQKHNLATALLDDKNCPGARGLSSSEKAILRKLRDAIQ
jgi:hypothetical protein